MFNILLIPVILMNTLRFKYFTNSNYTDSNTYFTRQVIKSITTSNTSI